MLFGGVMAKYIEKQIFCGGARDDTSVKGFNAIYSTM